MKKGIIVCALVPLLSLFSLTSKAGDGDSSHTKFATINVFFSLNGKPKIYVIVDDKATFIKFEDGGWDNEAAEGKIFGRVHEEMEKLSDKGYKLSSTAGIGQLSLSYTFEKE